MSEKKVTRRRFLKGLAAATGGAVLAGCTPQVVKETVVVEKPVEKIVKEIVKETVIVEGESSVVEKVVEKVVTATPQPATIYMWTFWTPPRDEAIQAALDKFNDLNPAITAKHQLIPQSGAQEKLLTAIAGGQPPDVFMLRSSHIPTYVDNQALMRIDRFMDVDNTSVDAWFQGDIQPCYYLDMVWALPMVGGGSYPVIYNLDHLEEAGVDPNDWPPVKSWDDFAELAGRLNIIENGEVQRMGFWPVDRGGYFPNEATYGHFMNYNGGRATSLDFKTAVFDAAYREALQWEVDTVDEYCGGYEQGQAFMHYARGGSADYNAPFYGGKTSITLTGPWEFSIIPGVAPDLRWGMCAIPYGPSYYEGFVKETGYVWSYGIPTDVAYPDASWKLTRWMTHDDGCSIFCRATVRPPALIREAESSFWEQQIPEFPHYIESLKAEPPAIPRPSFSGYAQVIQDAVEMAFRHTMTVDEACDWAIEEGQAIIDEYWASQA